MFRSPRLRAVYTRNSPSADVRAGPLWRFTISNYNDYVHLLRGELSFLSARCLVSQKEAFATEHERGGKKKPKTERHRAPTIALLPGSRISSTRKAPSGQIRSNPRHAAVGSARYRETEIRRRYEDPRAITLIPDRCVRVCARDQTGLERPTRITLDKIVTCQGDAAVQLPPSPRCPFAN